MVDHGPVPDGDSRIIEAIQELIEANRAARQVMVEGERILVEGIERLRAGEKISETLGHQPPGDQRQSTQDAYRRIDEARHQLRLLLIQRCLEEGMRAWEIAHAWGMSRQRIDRYIQEIKKGAVVEDPTDG
jgi:hypothetical protein